MPAFGRQAISGWFLFAYTALIFGTTFENDLRARLFPGETMVTESRWFNENVGLMLLDLLFAAPFAYKLLNREYDYFEEGEPAGWVPTVAPLLTGLWFFAIGLAGYLRGRSGKQE
jgi:hypothetical protein